MLGLMKVKKAAALLVASLAGLAVEPSPGALAESRPNILLAIADDWSWPHAGAYFAVGPFGDVDGSPTKTLLLDRRDDPAIGKYFRLAVAKRPAEELYDLRTDPAQIENVADRPQYAEEKRRLRAELDRWMRETNDPRAAGDDDPWDRYPYYGQPAATEPVKGAQAGRQ
jgi:hypothetical protein